MIDPASHRHARAQDAWTAFWADPTQLCCAAGAPEIRQAVTRHWSSFAGALAPGTRVLDLGCGASAVGRMLLAARPDLHITGIDSASIPPTAHPQLELLADTAMESLPFADQAFGAAVSQFGYEYSRIDESAGEIARVLAPGAKLSLLVHHAESAIVATTRSRLNAIVAFLRPIVRAAFCSGDAAAFNRQMSALVARYPHDALMAQLARSLPSRLGGTRTERNTIWHAIEEALAPELCIAQPLTACFVAPIELDDWSASLRQVCDAMRVSVLREPNGDPIAWRIDGTRGAARS